MSRILRLIRGMRALNSPSGRFRGISRGGGVAWVQLRCLEQNFAYGDVSREGERKREIPSRKTRDVLDPVNHWRARASREYSLGNRYDFIMQIAHFLSRCHSRSAYSHPTSSRATPMFKFHARRMCMTRCFSSIRCSFSFPFARVRVRVSARVSRCNGIVNMHLTSNGCSILSAAVYIGVSAASRVSFSPTRICPRHD